MSRENTQISSGLSSDIVKHLRRDGKTLKEIGKLAGLSESFISRVGKGERSFTVKHLLKLEKALKQPLPLLIIEVTKDDSLSGKMRELYRSLRKSLELSGRLRAKFLKSDKKSRVAHAVSRVGVGD